MISKREYISSQFPDAVPNSAGEIHTYCPFHEDRHPSFSINIDSGVFICGSANCGVRGNFAYFYKLCENIDSWKEVHEKLKQSKISVDFDALFGSQETRSKQQVTIDFPIPPFTTEINSVGYLQSKNLGPQIVDLFGLKFGVDGIFSGAEIKNTIVVPIYDLDGTFKTFQVRHLNPRVKPKWNGPSGSPVKQFLYGGWLLSDRTDRVWLVEGASDVWVLTNYGEQAVGLFSKEISSSQLNKIYTICINHSLTPVVCLDGDVPLETSQKLVKELLAYGLDARVVYLQDDEDPGSLSRERFSQLLEELNALQECRECG